MMRHVKMETLALSTPAVLMASVPPNSALAVLPSQSFVDQQNLLLVTLTQVLKKPLPMRSIM